MRERRIVLVTALLTVAGIAGGYLLGKSGDSTKTVTVTVRAGEPLPDDGRARQPCRKLGINPVRGRQGTCISNGITYTVVNQRTPLDLEQLRVEFVSAKTTAAAGPESARLGRRFFIATVRVTNKTDGDARFDEAEQVVLSDATHEYAEDRRTASSLRGSFVAQARQIKPGGSQTGEVIFTIPAGFVPRLRAPGANLVFTNFRDAGRIDITRRLGVVRLWK